MFSWRNKKNINTFRLKKITLSRAMFEPLKFSCSVDPDQTPLQIRVYTFFAIHLAAFRYTRSLQNGVIQVLGEICLGLKCPKI